MNNWAHCKNILCIRPDNMGDLVMTGPAIRAIKETFDCRITVLTSSSAAGIAGFMPEIDEVMVFDVPWVKNQYLHASDPFYSIVNNIRQKEFDAAVIFTVYSQNPLPTVMLAYLAGIPLRLAYCRENPYHLLTEWIPDKEPYTIIKHQVLRDLDLVAAIGAIASTDKLTLGYSEKSWPAIRSKLNEAGVDLNKNWLLLHAGVSEEKRSFPVDRLVEIARDLITEQDFQVLFTGSINEKELTDQLQNSTGKGSFSIAGLFSIEEFVTIIDKAEILISVNSGPVHIAAALGTPVIVLYAQTNPQHTPWRSASRVFYYSINKEHQSKNEVIRFVNDNLYEEKVEIPTTHEILKAVKELLER